MHPNINMQFCPEFYSMQINCARFWSYAHLHQLRLLSSETFADSNNNIHSNEPKMQYKVLVTNLEIKL